VRLVRPRRDEELGHSAGDCAFLGPGLERRGVCCNTLVRLEGVSSLGLYSRTDAAVGDGIFYLNWSISLFLLASTKKYRC